MSRAGPLLMLLVLAASRRVYAAGLRPGDQVRFVERDQHMPAHAAPGDSRMHQHFVSGLQVSILQINAAMGWIEVAFL
jgi:hypothetical protein